KARLARFRRRSSSSSPDAGCRRSTRDPASTCINVLRSLASIFNSTESFLPGGGGAVHCASTDGGGVIVPGRNGHQEPITPRRVPWDRDRRDEHREAKPAPTERRIISEKAGAAVSPSTEDGLRGC